MFGFSGSGSSGAPSGPLSVGSRLGSFPTLPRLDGPLPPFEALPPVEPFGPVVCEPGVPEPPALQPRAYALANEATAQTEMLRIVASTSPTANTRACTSADRL